MPGRLAVDFGTNNTRLALWDPGLQQAVPVRVPDVSELETLRDGEGSSVEVAYIPSLIHFAGTSAWIGKQVRDRGLEAHNLTFRWMKSYIAKRLALPRRIDGREITFPEAGAQFLASVLDYAAPEIGLDDDEEIAFTVPVEGYEDYQQWLTGACATLGVRRYRLLDEASAAALGYNVGIQAGDVYMVFDFGGGTLDVSIVRVEGEAAGGRRCRVLGKGGVELGGTIIDRWVYEDVLTHARKAPEDVRHISGLLLLEAERVKRELTTLEAATFAVTDPGTGAVLTKRYTRTGFEDLLEARGLFASLQGATDAALKRAAEAGYERDHIKAVLLVGGSSLIPCVRRAVRQMFGDRVRYHRPLDAVALGAAAFVGGIDFYDHIQHDYALRHYDRAQGDFTYKVIVAAGTPYPSSGPVAQLTVKASHDDQEYLGLSIYEVGRVQSCRPEQGTAIELVWDPSGAARFQEQEAPAITSHFWVNEKSPTFIHAEPPAKRGEPRFPVQFTIDGSKRLCVTVRDNLTGKPLMRDCPVIELT